jgi:L-threonylcarbamoyladenylate synthase
MVARMRAQDVGEDTLFRSSASAAPDVLMQELPDEEMIFLNLRTESYFGLDPMGTRMYRALLNASSVEDAYRQLAERFWPGPLTLVLPLRPDAEIAGLVTAGLETIALRSPAHPVMRALMESTGRPLAAPSANASGRISPTRAEHVARSLSGRIPLILDAGPTQHGLESTIVAVEGGQIRLLRPGPIDLDLPIAPGKTIEAPGQLDSHYAPAKPVRLNAREARPDEWLIGFGQVRGNSTLSARGDLVEAAAVLFERLHEAEAAPYPRIAVAPVPREGLGVAIDDRLRRAAAPRTDPQPPAS